MLAGTITVKDSLAPKLYVLRTTGALERMRGLLGKAALKVDEGLLITPCNSVHMFFMSFAIDVIFLSEDFQIMKISHALKPWRLAGCSKSKMSLELSAGTAERLGLKDGMFLSWEVD